MRMLIAVFACLVAGGCDETTHSSNHDAGLGPFKQIGEPCAPDGPPTSECGYWPQFYCSDSGACTSACNSDGDCPSGSSCSGAEDMAAGQCRANSNLDGG